MLKERRKLNDQRQVLEAKEIRGAAEIPIEDMLHHQAVMAFSFGQVAPQALEAARLEVLQLLSH